MRLRARSLTPQRRSPARDVTPSGRGGFHGLASPLRQVIWLEKFKAGHIDKYDAPTILKNSSRSIIQSLKLQEETIR
jgi:hypothetical protein